MLIFKSSSTLKTSKIPNNRRKLYYSSQPSTGINKVLKKDKVIEDIAHYAKNYVVNSHEAMKTSRYTIMDALGCGFLALSFKECKKLLGPVVEGTVVPNGVPVPGTKFVLDPVTAAFNIGAMIRWLDYNDTWLAAEWGHPSDNLGAILAATDFVSRTKRANTKLTMKQVTEYIVKTHEIQGVMALENAFNRCGLDHVILVKVASTALSTAILGGSDDQIFNAVSNAFLDGGVLRTYRHFPNAGSRKSWAAGDACQRAIWHSMNALKGEMGYPSALSTPTWGFYDSIFRGKKFEVNVPYGSYVMENVLFKVSYPAEFHAQTAVECAVTLHNQVKSRLKDVKAIHLQTHESAIRIIDKKGPLNNPADRDHCIQYMTAVGLIFGDLKAEFYEDNFAKIHPEIDELREKFQITEKKSYSVDYLDPQKRSIANCLQIEFKDGSFSEKVEVEYPIGHRRRRKEAFPLIELKFRRNAETVFGKEKVKQISELFLNEDKYYQTNVTEFMDLLRN